MNKNNAIILMVILGIAYVDANIEARTGDRKRGCLRRHVTVLFHIIAYGLATAYCIYVNWEG